jgi:hypothetical protein
MIKINVDEPTRGCNTLENNGKVTTCGWPYRI